MPQTLAINGIDPVTYRVSSLTSGDNPFLSSLLLSEWNSEQHPSEDYPTLPT